MAILINKVLSARTALKPLAEQKLPIKLSYQIAKFLSQTDEEERFYWTKVREIVQDCGRKNEDGSFMTNADGNVLIDPERVQECNERIQEVERIEVDVKLGITEEEVMALDGKVELSPIDIKAILDIVGEV